MNRFRQRKMGRCPSVGLKPVFSKRSSSSGYRVCASTDTKSSRLPSPPLVHAHPVVGYPGGHRLEQLHWIPSHHRSDGLTRSSSYPRPTATSMKALISCSKWVKVSSAIEFFSQTVVRRDGFARLFPCGNLASGELLNGLPVHQHPTTKAGYTVWVKIYMPIPHPVNHQSWPKFLSA